MFKKLAIWYLRITDCSVLINYELNENNIKQKGRRCYLYDNDFDPSVKLIDCNGDELKIPEGQFRFEYPIKQKNCDYNE